MSIADKVFATLRRFRPSAAEAIPEVPRGPFESRSDRASPQDVSSQPDLGLLPTRDSSWPNSDVSAAVSKVQRGDVAEAVAMLERAVRSNPRDFVALNDLGVVLEQIGRIDAALARFGQALELCPDNPRIWMNLASARMSARQWEPAVAAYRRAIVLDDRSAPAWSELGVALVQLGQDRDAEDACREALALRPGWREGVVNLATVLCAVGRFDEAQSEIQAILNEDDSWVAGWRKLASLHSATGDLALAEQAHRRALHLEPASAAIAFDLAHALLGQGNYEEGFALFERRFDAVPAWFSDEVRDAGRALSERRWTPQLVRGQHVVVLGEQGFGDQLMMFRYVARLGELGAAKVSVVCAPELLRLARSIPGVEGATSLKSLDRPDAPHLAIPALSLPFCLSSTPGDLPDSAYLGPQTGRVSAWPEIRDLPGLRVGMAWAGNSTADDRDRRDLSLNAFIPLLALEGVSFVSLQKATAGSGHIPAAWSGRIIDPMGRCDDFLDTAAVMAGLDLVICVDTAVAHLAGALGLPVWLLVKSAGEWRWGNASSSSLWYPKMRIFRQRLGGDWSEVVDAVRQSLEAESRGAGAPRPLH